MAAHIRSIEVHIQDVEHLTLIDTGLLVGIVFNLDSRLTPWPVLVHRSRVELGQALTGSVCQGKEI